jgi:murein DD-endopeptidase MepM/ murein hydrolase activator NlpD
LAPDKGLDIVFCDVVKDGARMKKKFLSIIIVPHTKTSTKTLTFSQKTLKMASGGAILIILLLVGFLVDYFSMGLIRSRYKSLSREAAEQRLKIANYEKSITQLETAVANFENYAKKLNVMAGLKSPDVLKGPAGVGGGPSEPEAEASDPQSVLPPAGGPPSALQGSIQNLSQKAQSVESNLNSLVSFFETQSVRLATTPSIMPTAGWLNSPYGMRPDPFTGKVVMHWGVDISTNIGNPIVSTADGIVLSVLNDKYLGKHVVISHGNGITTVYGHMNAFAVRSGQKVKRGDVIGYVGQTGKAVGPHVHYEVRLDGRAVNPYNYILEE